MQPPAGLKRARTLVAISRNADTRKIEANKFGLRAALEVSNNLKILLMKTSYVKILVLISILVLGVAFPIGGSTSFTLILSFTIVLLLIGLFIPYLIQYNSLLNHHVIQYPKWSDKLSHKAPLTYTHFLGYISLSFGTGELVGELIRMQTVNVIGILMIALWVGVVLGNNLVVKNSSVRYDLH